MLQADTLAFLRELEDHNDREWFEANRSRYDAARADFLSLVKVLIARIGEFDPEVAMANPDPSKTMMRIYRDVRFSTDKRPYKANFFCYLSRGGRKTPLAGYYLNIGAQEHFCGAGLYRPEAPELARVRQEIDYNLSEWEELVASADFRARYGEVRCEERLSRPPKGYAKDNPALPWLQMKDYYIYKAISDAQMRSEGIADLLAADYRGLQGMVAFLNRAVEISE